MVPIPVDHDWSPLDDHDVALRHESRAENGVPLIPRAVTLAAELCQAGFGKISFRRPLQPVRAESGFGPGRQALRPSTLFVTGVGAQAIVSAPEPRRVIDRTWLLRGPLAAAASWHGFTWKEARGALGDGKRCVDARQGLEAE